jgi:predicted HTH transcriptional regulator
MTSSLLYPFCPYIIRSSSSNTILPAMTNTTLRERFGIDTKNSALASRIIRDTVKQGLILLSDPDSSRKYSKYLPFWA